MNLFERLFEEKNINTKRLDTLSFDDFCAVCASKSDSNTLVVLLWLMVRNDLFDRAIDFATRIRDDFQFKFRFNEVIMYCLYQRHDIENGDKMMRIIKDDIKQCGRFDANERRESSLALGLIKKYLNPGLYPDVPLRKYVYETVVMYIPLLKHAAKAALEAGLYKRCIDMCEQQLKCDADDDATPRIMAEAYTKIGQTENAIKCLKYSARINPFQTDVWMRLAALEETLGRYSDAADSHERWLCLIPNPDSDWTAKYIHCLRLGGDTSKALSVCRDLEAKGKENPKVTTEYAAILEDLGDYSSAISLYQKAESGTGDRSTSIRIAVCKRLLGQNNDAKEWAYKAIAESRDKDTKTSAELILAQIELDEEKPVSAELRCSKISPTSPEAQDSLARIMVKAMLMQGKSSEAKAYLQSLGEKGGDQSVVLMAAALYKEEKKLDAVDVMLLPCQIHPELEGVFYDQCPEAREDAIFQGRYKQILAYTTRTENKENNRQ